MREYIFDLAERTIVSGGLVIVPTETFYAIAADPFQEQAVRRIFALKFRDEDKPLPLIAADRRVLEERLSIKDETLRKLMERFWPGSLTILLPAQGFSRLLTGPSGKIGVRVPHWCAARILAARAGGLITATSANVSGRPAPDDVSKIDQEVIESVDMVMNLGPTPGGRPSTVLDPAGNGVRIVRDGAVDEALIREFFRGLSWA